MYKYIKKGTFWMILVFSSIVLLLNIFTPLLSDDWHYNFIFGTQQPISSISDIIKSQWSHYFEFNGRFVPHFFVQLFDGLLGKEIFNVVNTLFFISFLLLLSYSFKPYFKSILIPFSLITLFVFLLLPGFGDCFLWMSGACNYLWVFVFILLFDHLLQKNIQEKKFYPFLFLFGVLCGWTNEAIVIGITAGYLSYYTFHWKELVHSRLWLLLGLCLGGAFLVFSPGSIGRATRIYDQSVDIYTSLISIVEAIKGMNNLRITFIMLLLLLWSIKQQKINIKKFFNDNQIWIVAFVISMAFILFTKHTDARSRFGIEMYALILLMKLLSLYKVNHRVLIGCNIGLYTMLLYVLHLSSINYKNYNYAVSQLEDKGNHQVLVKTLTCNNFFKRFVLESFNEFDIFNRNLYVLPHFGKERVNFVPEELYLDINSHPDNYSTFYNLPPLPFYIRRIDEQVNIQSVSFKLNDYDFSKSILWVQKIKRKIPRYTIKEIPAYYSEIHIDNTRYLVVAKDEIAETRLAEIVYK